MQPCLLSFFELMSTSCLIQFPSWWEGNYEVGCGVLPWDLWFCHSAHSMALPASWKPTKAKLPAYGGVYILMLPTSIILCVFCGKRKDKCDSFSDLSRWWFFFCTGVQNCGGSAILKKVEWKTDYCFTEGDLSTSPRERTWYSAGLSYLCYLLRLTSNWISCLVAVVTTCGPCSIEWFSFRLARTLPEVDHVIPCRGEAFSDARLLC